ncbi:MAG: flagellar hook-basal body complex protein, partial [Proteobacteria bacterium]|nr:flagellar hook-basal body complex protein [Pseudomonadota bacterium]
TLGSTGYSVGASSWTTDGNAGNIVADVNTAGAGTDNTFQVDISGSTTVSTDVDLLRLKVIASDADFDTANERIRLSSGTSTTLIFEDDGIEGISVDPTGLKDSTGTRITNQSTSFTTSKQDRVYTDFTQIKFAAVPTTGDSMIINGITYNFTTGEAEDTTGADTTIYIDGPLDRVLADLRAAIAANDLEFDSNSVRLRASGSPHDNTLILDSKANGSTYTISVLGLTVPKPTEPDGTSGFISSNLITVQTEPAISFTSSGLPNKFNIAELDIRNFSNGAANFDDDANNVKQITLDFGTLNEANGMTQFGAAFSPVFINQNGSRFGTFAGLTVNANGLMTALFDNGETRPIFQIPMATFVNVNGLESKSGNVWNATEASGDVTLRVADNGPAGQIVQGALEASTVDIGEEFTKMIVVQRAFSASAKIISTADDMLEELLRTKR